VNKKISVIIIFTFILFISFAGCVENNKKPEEKQYTARNSNPVAIIHTPKDTYYFGDIIELDASESYDSDGKIVSYSWDFGDGGKAEGKKVKHTYEFENEFDVTFPIIYTTFLYVKDDDNSIKVTDHQIMLFPKEYKFYFDSEKLTVDKPTEKQDMLTKTGSKSQISYSLDNSISIQKCKWNATIHLDKPMLTIATKISISFYDYNDTEIANKEEKLGLNTLWIKKTVKISGELDKTEEIKSIKITITSFSLRNKINILNGGEKASFICFDFTV